METDRHIRSIAILGGGAIGWMAAAALSRVLKRETYTITLVEAPKLAVTVAGEGTVPSFGNFLRLLGVDEDDFIAKTGGTFSLGTEFKDWHRPGASFFHGFGAFGAKIAAVPFHQYWLRLRALGEAGSFEDYSMAAVAARLGRFCRPVEDNESVLSLFSYGLNFETAKFAAYMRAYAEGRGVRRADRELAGVRLRGTDGFIEALELDGGNALEADFFIDCTADRGALIHRHLKGAFEDWSRWLPCDRAIAVPCERTTELAPYTQSFAEAAGWRWRIRLQNQTHNGICYASGLTSDDEAAAVLLERLEGAPIGEPRVIKFTLGRPVPFWTRNCLTLAAGYQAPLEPASFHLAQTALMRLLSTFPDRTFNPAGAEEYNRLTVTEHERIRDFLILHHAASARGGSAFWDHCRRIELPESLTRKAELFKSSGRLSLLPSEHFGEESWLSVFFGNETWPRHYDPLADVFDLDELRAGMTHMAGAIRQGAQAMPTQRQFLERRK